EEHKVKLTERNVVEILCKVDIVAECFDRAESKAMLSMNVLKNLKIPLVAVSGIAGYSDCEKLQVRKVMERFWLVGDGESAAKPKSGLTAAKVGIAASLQAAKIVELLIEDGNKGKWDIA
ncbi:MAG: sulfur carrier protein ThiS adenylyltransferase ThiF, partial [Lentisphaeria bacterium]